MNPIAVGHFSRAPQECILLLLPDILVVPDWEEHYVVGHPWRLSDNYTNFADGLNLIVGQI